MVTNPFQAVIEYFVLIYYFSRGEDEKQLSEKEEMHISGPVDWCWTVPSEI